MIYLFFEIINSNKKSKKKMAFIKAAIDTNKKQKDPALASETRHSDLGYIYTHTHIILSLTYTSYV